MKYNQKSIVVLNFLKYPIDSKCKSMGPREESARVEKIRQLKENQQKWLRERQACCDVANAVESTGGLRTTCNPHDKQNDVVNPVNLLNKITERITGLYPVELVICCSDSIEAIVLLKLASGSTKLLSETMLSSSVSFSFPIPMPNLVWRSFLRLMRFLTFLPKSISFSL